MKKTLIALAALAATGAYAQSSVTIDGVMDAGYQSLKFKGQSVSGYAGNGSATSQINFRGTQDLGGGLKAGFRVESDWNTASNNGNTGVGVASGATFGNGEIRTGLSGAFGAVDIGAVNNAQLTAFLTGQPFGTAVGSAFRGIFVTDAASALDGSSATSVSNVRGVSASVVRFDNSIRYTTPNIAGFSGTLLKVNKNDKAAVTANNASLGNYAQAGVTEFSLNYNNGPINAVYAVTKQNLVGAATNVAIAAGGGSTAGANLGDATAKTLGANYDLGVAKVYFLNQKLTSNGTTLANAIGANANIGLAAPIAAGTPATLNRNVTTFSVTVPMGAAVLMAQIGGAKDNNFNAKSNLTAFGADYNLSKTTALYGRYESIKDDAYIVPGLSNANAVNGDTKRTRLALGLRVGF